jgi:cytochrome c biogenesis protein CcdA
MDSLWLSLSSAVWLGILTSISPCPLATNIAAISYIGRKAGRTGPVLLNCLSYTAGRIFSYLMLGLIITGGILSIPGISNFLQEYMNIALGPILILTGFIILNIIKIKWLNFAPREKTTNALGERGNIWGAFVLGIIFALSLCPVSAGLFFGSLIPLAVKNQSYFLLPSLYGLGTGLPVIICGFVIAFSVGTIGKLFSSLSLIEKWGRRITGIIFIIVGIYYILVYILELPL